MHMPARVVFLLMSAQQPGPTVEQLVDALSPHPVVVHHDFTKKDDFKVDRPNASIVADPKVTAWGAWGFTSAILHTLRHIVDTYEFDYCQILSPTCLPIRPVHEFIAHVSNDPSEAHVDLFDLGEDLDTWMSYMYRAYFPVDRLRYLVARRFGNWYFRGREQRMQRNSLTIRRLPVGPPTAFDRYRRAAAVTLSRLMVSMPYPACPYTATFRPAVGSTWFGARRHVLESLLQMANEPGLARFYSPLLLADEHMFQTLLHNSRFRLGPSNHAVNTFNEAHPRTITDDDLPQLMATQRFFARKFSDNVDDPARLRVIASLGTSADAAPIGIVPDPCRVDATQPFRNPPVQRPLPSAT
jgi:hypothetical protein